MSTKPRTSPSAVTGADRMRCSANTYKKRTQSKPFPDWYSSRNTPPECIGALSSGEASQADRPAPVNVHSYFASARHSQISTLNSAGVTCSAESTVLS